MRLLADPHCKSYGFLSSPSPSPAKILSLPTDTPQGSALGQTGLVSNGVQCHRCTWVSTHLSKHTQRPEQVARYPPITLRLVFWNKASLQPGAHSFDLAGWPALPTLEWQAQAARPRFTWMLGIQTQVLGLNIASTPDHWAICLSNPHLGSESTKYSLPVANYFKEQFCTSILSNPISITTVLEKHALAITITTLPLPCKCQHTRPLIKLLFIAHLVRHALGLHLTHPRFTL